MDEIFTWKEVSDRSLWHLLCAIEHGADGGEPLFYTTVWVWAKAFGSSDLSLRLYSCLGMCGAFLITWRCIRRYYGLWATAFGVLTIWGGSGLLLEQNAEGRFYGLFMLTVAVGVDLYLRLAARATVTRLLLVLTLVSQAALVLTHIMGLFYSALILLAMVVLDAGNRRLRIQVYLFHVAGWLALAVWIPAIRATMAHGKPYGWIPVPTFYNFFDSYLFWEYLPWLSLLQRHSPDLVFQVCRRGAQLAIALPLAVVLLLSMKQLLRWRQQFFAKEEHALLLVAFALLLMPIVLFILSLLVTPVFVPRYMLPSGIGVAVVLAAFAGWLGANISRSLAPVARVALMLLVIFLIFCPVGSALLRGRLSDSPRFLDVQRLDGIVSPNQAMVIDWQQDFSKVMRYSRKPAAGYYFLLDWPAALAGPRTHVLDYHLMRAYREVGYYSQSIRDSHAFLCSERDFLVLDAHPLEAMEQGTSWFDFAIRNNPQFGWKTLASFDGPEVSRELIAVHRRGSLSDCAQR